MQTYKEKHDHSLWNVLIDELVNCRNLLENRKTLARDTPDIMVQHSACIGRMRGIVSMSPVAPSRPPHAPHLSGYSSFSNPIQRSISTQLSQHLSPSQANEQESQEMIDSMEEEPGYVKPVAAAAALTSPRHVPKNL